MNAIYTKDMYTGSTALVTKDQTVLITVTIIFKHPNPGNTEMQSYIPRS